MNKSLSVIICTHNPRMDYLQRVLAGLQVQSLHLDDWELIVVDNGSSESLDGRINLDWHPASRVVREDRLGLIPARLRGIADTSAPILIFVDDDNVLDPDYLEQSLKISVKWPILGAWGGQTLPEFEVEPPEWIEQFWGHLALRKLDRDHWSNRRDGTDAPIGAGMVVRRHVADAYATRVGLDEIRATLGRRGCSLMSGEDLDLALTAVDMGLGTGLFKALKLTHLISADRLSEKHLLNLQERLSYSATILNSIRGLEYGQPRRSLLTRVHEWGHLYLRTDGRTRRFQLAIRRGAAAAEGFLRTNGKSA